MVSVGGSYDSASSGRTHQSPGDVGLLATLPGWNIHVPGHPDEVEGLLREASTARDSHYIRLAEDMNRESWATVAGMVVVRRGTEAAATIISVGPTLDDMVEATKGIDATVLYASTVRPFDTETLRVEAEGTDIVLVEPYLVGTSSSEVSAALLDSPHRLLALGVPLSEHRRYGTGAQHKAAHGLETAGLRQSIREFLRIPVTA